MLGDERISQAYAENAEIWITVVRDRLDPFQLELTDPAILASVGDPAGLVILDAGCGEGHLVRELTAARARHVHGVDTCAEFIAAARSHPEHRADSTTFHHGDVAALPLADASVDLWWWPTGCRTGSGRGCSSPVRPPGSGGKIPGGTRTSSGRCSCCSSASRAGSRRGRSVGGRNTPRMQRAFTDSTAVMAPTAADAHPGRLGRGDGRPAATPVSRWRTRPPR